MARVEELVEAEDAEFRREPAKNSAVTSEVNRIQDQAKLNAKRNGPNRPHNRNQTRDSRSECSRCGRKGHSGKDAKCPAADKKCNKCGATGHFAAKCYSKKRAADSNENRAARPEKQQKTTEEVQWIENIVPTEDQDFTDEEDVYAISTGEDKGNSVNCTVGDVMVKAIIDSGCRCNLVDEKTWTMLKTHNAIMYNERNGSDKTFKAYGGHELTVIGMFEAYISAAGTGTNATFYVIAGKGQFLMGRETAQVLNVLLMRTDVNAISDSGIFPKMKGIMIDIPIRRDVKPVAQPHRRVPVPLEKVVNEKIDKMVAQGIVEKVKGPSKWISPLVVVPRSHSDEIRVCVDMRRANLAVERENFVMPTFDDILPHLNKAKLFSKIDIKNAFHQVSMNF